MRETRQVRQGWCRNDDTFRDFYFASAELIFCDYRYCRKMSFRPHIPFATRQPPKPAKGVVSPPTSTLAYDSRTNLRRTSEITTVRLFEHTAGNSARFL